MCGSWKSEVLPDTPSQLQAEKVGETDIWNRDTPSTTALVGAPRIATLRSVSGESRCEE